MRWISPLLLFALLFSAGCSKSANNAPGDEKLREGMVKEKPVAGKVDRAGVGRDKAEENEKLKGNGFVAFNQDQDGGKGIPPEKKAKEKPRKIRYTAELRLIVEDFDKATSALDDAKAEAKGEYARVEVTGSATTVRSGTWRVRVPVDSLHTFRKAVAKIGDVDVDTLDSEDMTAQFYDLQADIENRKVARETLRDLLKETGKKEMKHYLEVWDKLEAVSNEINRKEGQLRLWADLTDLTTVTVTMREKQKFDAPKKVEDKEIPTFGMRADKTWNDSWDNFIGFCELVAIVAIAVTPWLPIPLVFLTGIWLLGRRLSRAAPAPVVEAAEGKKT